MVIEYYTESFKSGLIGLTGSVDKIELILYHKNYLYIK